VANTFGQYNGDGHLIYPGADLKPYSSIRFEALRDGFEDYEYLALLEARLALLESLGGHDNLVASLLPLLNVPGDLCGTDISFTSDPARLAAYRLQLADAIEAAYAVEVPEPSTTALLTSGTVLLGLWQCRRTRGRKL
jgi:hypothetical protein